MYYLVLVNGHHHDVRPRHPSTTFACLAPRYSTSACTFRLAESTSGRVTCVSRLDVKRRIQRLLVVEPATSVPLEFQLF
jgi:hypothetical protein